MLHATLTPETKPARSRDILDFIGCRKANGIDDEKIAQLLIATFTKTYAEKLPHVHTPEERIQELQSVFSRRLHGEVMVLELGYRIIGTFSLIRPDSTLTQSWLNNAANLRCVAIDPDFHGLGFSQLLLEEAERLALTWHSSFICLHVQKGAAGVARLYQQRGFIRDRAGDMTCMGNESEGYHLPLNKTALIRAEQ